MRGYRVLVVDDAPDVHEVVGTYLELSGYQVSHAFTGEEALSTMDGETPDLVLLDVQMPVMDGFHTLETIKTLPRFEDVPVIFLSSMDRPNLKVKGLQLGADDYVIKPFDRTELLARVTAALRRSERYRRLDGTLRGDLAHISLEELLQTMEIGRKTARLRMLDLDGEMAVRAGLLIECRWRSFYGAAAMSRLLLLARGGFIVEFFGVPGDIEPVGPIREVLLDLMVEGDELRVILGGLPGLGDLLELRETESGLAVPDSLSLHDRFALTDLLVEMEGDLRSNARAIGSALARGSLRVVSEKE